MKSVLKDKSTRLFFVLGGIFITNALVAEFMGVKIFSLERSLGMESLNWTIFGVEGLGLNLSAGVMLWPIVFVLTDVINEYFGHRGVKILSYFTVGLIIYAFIMIYFTISLAPNEWWQSESGMLGPDPEQHLTNMDLAFKKIFGQGLWIIIGSLVAFLVGQFVDVYVFQKLKRFTGGNKIWLRATGSTLVSQFIDSFVVLFIAFYIGADWDLVRVIAIGCVNYSYKFLLAILLTPLIYLAHNWIDNYLGEEEAERLKAQAALKS